MGAMIPIFEKENMKEVMDYRGISLIDIRLRRFCKVY
jgi:hypothetical protein